MARHTTNPSKEAKEIRNSNSGSIPSFDEKALSALTAKIEKGFGEGKSQQPGDPHHGQKGGKGAKHERPARAQLRTKPVEPARGTKRDSRGNAKVAGGQQSSAKHTNTSGNDDRAILLKEILALGGTEEDLDLVADAIYEEDNHSTTALPDTSFRTELASFIAGLGIEEELDEVDSDGSDVEVTDNGSGDASGVNDLDVSGGEYDVVSMTTGPLQKPPTEDLKRLVSTI
jgi:ribosome biogenesis protein MAK21